MGRRSRRRAQGDSPAAPTTDYADADGNVLTLRGSLTPATRRAYAELLSEGSRPAATAEDVWQRAVEFLFERLAVRWVIAGVPIERQRELLGRLRLASQAERRWVRDVLRRHLAEWFPEMRAP